MRREDLERYLDRSDELGFVKETTDPDYLGWILLSKRRAHDRYLSLLAPGEDPEFVERQEALRRRPYQVRVIELRRDVHESDRYETNDDYRVNEVHRFASLDEVEDFIRQFGHTLTAIRWRADIDAP